MSGFRRPVVKLFRALYGHPDSGTMWEQHCDTHVKSVGFAPVGEEWPSCYFHHKLRVFLVIYVDDFKMAGPKSNLSSGWSLLQKGLVIETPVPIGVYLGCGHEEGTTKVGDIVARTMTYNMEDFLTSCVDRYLELARNGVKLRSVATPFLVEDQGISPQGAPSQSGPFSECPWCKHSFLANTQKPAKDLNWKVAVSVNGSSADSTSGAEPATGDVYVSHKHVEAQCDHNAEVEVRAVPAQSSKEHGGTPPPSPDEGRLQPII